MATELQFSLRGEGGQVTVKVAGYAYPDIETGWDANWLRSTTEVQLDGFGGTLDLSTPFLATELKTLLSDAIALYRNLEGALAFASLEGTLAFKIEMQKQGTCRVDGNLRDAMRMRGDLWFTFESDQTFIGEMLSSLQQVVDAYPPRDTRQ